MAEFMDKFKQFVGLDDYDDEDDMMDPQEFDYDEEESVGYDDRDIETTRSKVVDINKTNKEYSRRTVKVMVYEPSSYDDVTKLIDEIRNERIIVMNMLRLETEVKQKIFYCMSGAVYALDGNMQKVAKDIFVIAPSNVEVDSKKLSEEMANRGIIGGRM